MRKVFQKDRILEYLEDNGSITSWEAIKEFGITRLSAVIYDLKKEGYIIDSKYETAKNRYGDKMTYSRYYLKEVEENA